MGSRHRFPFAYDTGKNERGLVIDLAPRDRLLETRVGYGFAFGAHEIVQPYIGWAPDEVTVGLGYFVGPVLVIIVVGDESFRFNLARRW